MPFRRRSKTLRKLARAAGTVCEPLESRQLLTALVNGRFQGTNSQFDGRTDFEYRQANGNATVRISVFGNITAEFVGAFYDPSTPSLLTLADLVPSVPNNTSNVFLYQIYVVKSDINSAISISVVPNPGIITDIRPMTPFTGTVSIRTNDATTVGLSNLVTLQDGGVYIGAETPNTLTTPQNNVPLIQTTSTTGLGMRPAGRIYAGLEVAKGNNLGKFFVGGTITGRVNVPGSMDMFYAGNILTGDASGIFRADNTQQFTNPVTPGEPVVFPKNNFYVGGDIHNIVTANSIGTVNFTAAIAGDATLPTYKTGAQIRIGGRVGEIFQVNSFLGQALIQDDPRVVSPKGAQHEIEYRGPDLTVPAISTTDEDPSYFDPLFFGYDISLNDDPAARFNNDTFATAQYLGSASSATLGTNTGIDLIGTLRNQGVTQSAGGIITASDNVDYYAVALLGGQSIDVQILDGLVGVKTEFRARIGIFDPDGRLIATNYSKINDLARMNEPIHITADRPGAYRIAVADDGDVNFDGSGTTGAVDPTDTKVHSEPRATINYELKVQNVGNVALGGLIANANISTLDSTPLTGQLDRGIEVLNGDIGEIRAAVGTAGGTLGAIASQSAPWRVDNGNLRSMEASVMGVTRTDGEFITGSGPDFLVPKGSVGLLRTTGTALTNVMQVDDDADTFPTADDDLSRTSRSLAVGYDIQLVDCAGTLEGDLLANRAIGVIRAAQIGGVESPNGGFGGFASSPVIQVNVDKLGNDGVIDLIDVSGNLNSPAIMTGPGGNVRYIHVVGTAFQDSFFGPPSTPEETTYDPGVQAFLTDDSGTNVILTPLPRVLNTIAPLPPTRLSNFFDPPQLTVLTYPIRGAAGKAIVRVVVTPVDDTSDNIVHPGGGGLQVDAGANGAHGSAEIGDIQVSGLGNPITFNPFLPPPGRPDLKRGYFDAIQPVAPAEPTRDLTLLFQGYATIDVWNINASATATTITAVTNNTVNGEIVNMVGAGTPDVRSILADWVGIAKAHTGAAVNGLGFGTPSPTLDSIFPFLQQRNRIQVANLEMVSARKGVGNIIASNIGTIIANSDNLDDKTVFEGIDAPIVVRQTGTSQLTGNIVLVSIGEGILPSGTGQVGLSGIYADGLIDQVVGARGADIRGDIVATGTTTRVTQQGTDFFTGTSLANPDGTPQLVSTPTWVIGSVGLVGGSIIDAVIMQGTIPIANNGTGGDSRQFVQTIATVEQADGFNNPFFDIGAIGLTGVGGIMGAYIAGQDIGPIAVNGGFGMINSQVLSIGASVMAGITVDGYGLRDDKISSGDVRGINATGTGKLADTTGYSATARFSERFQFDPYGQRFLDASNDLHKYLGTTKARPKNGAMSETGVIQDSVIVGSRSLGTVLAQDIVAKNTVATDPDTGVKTRIPYGDARYPMRISFPNNISTISVRSSITGLSLSAGALGNVYAGHDIGGAEFDVGGTVNSIVANRLLGSTLFNVTGAGGTVNSVLTKTALLASFNVSVDIVSMTAGTDLSSKFIRIGRNFGTLHVNGSILTGARIGVAKTLSALFVGKDVKAGATINAHAINSQTVKGQISGDIIIT